jgi:ribulose-5-phosphate 4-epimerase/fuculose-1-phosphate aldolase
MYCERSGDHAVVHLHCTHAVGVSVLREVDASDVLPPLTAYFAMRVGRLPLVPYFPPGDATLARAVQALAGRHHAVLLANHGPVVSGRDLKTAQFAIEELEETAKLFLLLGDRSLRPLTEEQAAPLRPAPASTS